jgi:hypothetical protein
MMQYQQLIKTKASICGNLVDEFGLAQATISQHPKELKVPVWKGNRNYQTLEKN